MSGRVFNVLFLCTWNSARSIIAEAVLQRLAGGKFNAYSAGSQPMGAVHPYAIALLANQNYKVDDLRSKSWEEFSGPDAPKWILFSLFVTMRPRKFAQSGQVNP